MVPYSLLRIDSEASEQEVLDALRELTRDGSFEGTVTSDRIELQPWSSWSRNAFRPIFRGKVVSSGAQSTYIVLRPELPGSFFAFMVFWAAILAPLTWRLAKRSGEMSALPWWVVAVLPVILVVKFLIETSAGARRIRLAGRSVG